MAKLLLGCYRTGDANDPAIYSGAIIAVLSDYPVDVVRKVVDPRSGIPSTSKWLPTVAEVKEACEAIMGPIRREEERLARAEERRRVLSAPVEDRTSRPTYEELQERFAADGILIGNKRAAEARAATAADLIDEYGITQEQWDAIPNAPKRGTA